ncbi:hypothetical protein [Ulvibacterium sp.]|uniref:hypothetical protein n=1 Tax=Ulvibacterium sp. TaxID=2665914 RepID=UPI003BA96A9A
MDLPSSELQKQNSGEKNKLLLEKIKELTLYTIEQQKTVYHLIGQINLLKE